MTRRLFLPFLAVFALVSCRAGRNYSDPFAPRWIGAAPAVPPVARDTLRVVSFNIQYARHIDSALAVLGDPALRKADIVLLQEMDAIGTQRIAAVLGMGYVYYPAINARRTQRDFGNAILSRWPIEDDDKLILPHPARFDGSRRIAVAATIRTGNSRVRVYSTHFGTIADIGPGRRRDQLDAIMRDAEPFDRVIIGGDMNSSSIGEHATAAGYAWPTPTLRTARLGMRYDHFFLRGLHIAGPDAVGVIEDVRGSSDHRPIWARIVTGPSIG
ncbi:MAG: endonuclease/exonuclease/phosphatase family protein [Gemmatimonadales bacterium]